MTHKPFNNLTAPLPLLDAVKDNTGEIPDEVSADNGFCSESKLEGLTERTVRGYVAAGCASKPGGGHRSRDHIRKYVVEQVFGQIKQARSFRQFLLRGLDKVKSEWAMICTAHNLAKPIR